MDIRFHELNDITIVAIEGSVDGMTADAFLSTVGEQVRGGKTRLVADFTGVAYTSSAGLRALLATTKEARSRGGDFRLAAVAPEVHRVLELSGFTTILKLYSDVASAVQSYSA
jgi:anti-sigma B factor antagonist